MKERPILFSGPMVKAILEGRKTMTRRKVKAGVKDDWNNCPFGVIGDRLWVREAHAIVPRTAYAHSDGVFQKLRPDDNHDAAIYREGFDRSAPRWKPSIHMPRWASRITLEITNVEVEQLKDISESDAKAEGAPLDIYANAFTIPQSFIGCVPFPTQAHHYGFQVLWGKVYGANSWIENPLVWAISFRRVA